MSELPHGPVIQRFECRGCGRITGYGEPLAAVFDDYARVKSLHCMICQGEVDVYRLVARGVWRKQKTDIHQIDPEKHRWVTRKGKQS